MMETLAIVIITEIMYNPASSEKSPVQSEWVELYNPSDQSIDISGWYLSDEDGRTDPLPMGTVINPRQAIVLIPGSQSIEEFQQGWGMNIQAIPVNGWGTRGLRNLANEPDSMNEVLTLRRDNNTISDEVNYDDEPPWPTDKPEGPSIYLLPHQVDAIKNDSGSSWNRSELNVHGGHAAKATDDYSDKDVGSPGVVIVVNQPGLNDEN